MIVRCPQCAHTRSVSEDYVPSTAEFATCPRCKLHFRFRTLPKKPRVQQRIPAYDETTTEFAQPSPPPRYEEQPVQDQLAAPSHSTSAAGHKDIWEAMDSLQEQWEPSVTEPANGLPAYQEEQLCDAQKPDTELSALQADDLLRPFPPEPLENVQQTVPHISSPPQPAHPLKAVEGKQKQEEATGLSLGKSLLSLTKNIFSRNKKQEVATEKLIQEKQRETSVSQLQQPYYEEPSVTTQKQMPVQPELPLCPNPVLSQEQLSTQHGAYEEQSPPLLSAEQVRAEKEYVVNVPPAHSHTQPLQSAPPVTPPQPVQAPPTRSRVRTVTPESMPLFAQEPPVVQQKVAPSHPPETQISPIALHAEQEHYEQEDDPLEPFAASPAVAVAEKLSAFTAEPVIVCQSTMDLPPVYAEERAESTIETLYKPVTVVQKEHVPPLVPVHVEKSESAFPPQHTIETAGSQEEPDAYIAALRTNLPVEQLAPNEENIPQDEKNIQEFSAVTEPIDTNLLTAMPPLSMPLAETTDTDQEDDDGIVQSIEEKVNKDILLLTANADRPIRELGILDELSRRAEEEETYEIHDSIPWENIRQHGWVRAFLATMHMVMFEAGFFFKKLTEQGPLTPSYIFLMIQGYLALICSSVWVHALNLFVANANTPLIAPSLALPTLLLLTPVFLGITQIITASFIQLLLKMTNPEHANFALIFRILGYSVAPLVLSIIPFIGPIAGLLWFLIAFTTGCRVALKLTMLQLVLALLPLLASMMALLYVLFG